MLTDYEQEGDNNCFHGGTIFNDATTGAIWVENQESLCAGKLLWPKLTSKSDSGIYFVQKSSTFTVTTRVTVDVFHADCNAKNQSQSFVVVGAHHQNVHAEHAIQTLMYMARTRIWC